MTQRLFDGDPYLQRFEARLLDIRQDKEGLWLRLDQTTFYPEGGGQPADWGWLEAGGERAQISDVQQDGEGLIWHRADRALPEGSAVSGAIDWPRRFDHMQQHAGEHILAGCVQQLEGGFTHGLHIGREFNSIDVSLPEGRTRLDQQALDAIERMANERVQQDAPMRGWYPEDEELRRLPLRKQPTVDAHIRVVAAGDFEYVACGGTHVGSTGQIGLIKILACEPARGKMRLQFVCGGRAVRHCQMAWTALRELSQRLSSPPADAPAALEALTAQQEAQRLRIRELEQEQAAWQAERLLSEALPLPQGGRLVCAHMGGLSREGLAALARLLIAHEGLIALLSADQAGGRALLFARHPAAIGDMAALIRESGAKGGGKPDYAQGSAPDSSALALAGRLLTEGRGTL